MPPGAISLVDCTYGLPVITNGRKVASSRPVNGTVIRGAAAVRGYVDLIDQLPLAGARCAAKDNARHDMNGGARDVLRFTYSDGRTLTLGQEWPCDAVVGPGSRLARLSFDAGSMLIGLQDIPAKVPRRTDHAPDLVGLSAAAAAHRTRNLSVTAEVMDTSVPVGTIVAQAPAAGAPNPSGLGIDVTEAVRPEPACTSRHLAMTFGGGGAGAGTTFSSLTIRDVGHRPCSLRGPVRVTSLDAGGRALTTTLVHIKNAPMVLSPDKHEQRPDAGADLLAVTTLSSLNDAVNCDGPTTIPSRWQLVVHQGRGTTASLATRPGVEGKAGLRILICGGTVGVGPITLQGAPVLQ